MRAELKSLHSPDVDLESFVPAESSNFAFLLQAEIGPEGGEAADTFSFEVCTPEWLVDQHENQGSPDVVLGAHKLLVFSYDLGQIRAFLSRYCERCVGETWPKIAERLSRIGAWEFTDYQDS